MHPHFVVVLKAARLRAGARAADVKPLLARPGEAVALDAPARIRI